jgi:hypothetical protein
MDSNGKEAKRLDIPVKLSVSAKTLTNTKSVLGTIVSADGYIHLASHCGIICYFPDKIIVDGHEVPNGSKNQDGTIYYRCICAGRDMTGNVQFSQGNIEYNVETYIRQDMLAKEKSNPTAIKVRPYRGRDEYGQPRNPPKKDHLGNEFGDPDDNTWAGYQLDEAQVLWIDTSYPEAAKWAKDIQQERKFEGRKAKTMAQRNAVKSHPNIVNMGIGNIEGSECIAKASLWVGDSGPLHVDNTIFKVDVGKQLAAAASETDVENVKMHGSNEYIDVTEEQFEEAQAESDAVDSSDAPDGAPVSSRVSDEELPLDDEDPRSEALKFLNGVKGDQAKALEKCRDMMGIPESATFADLETEKLMEIKRLVEMAK